MSDYPKAAKYITDRLARMSRPARLRVPQIAEAVAAWHVGNGEYPFAGVFSTLLGFKVNRTELKLAEQLHRYNVVCLARQSPRGWDGQVVSLNSYRLAVELTGVLNAGRAGNA